MITLGLNGEPLEENKPTDGAAKSISEAVSKSLSQPDQAQKPALPTNPFSTSSYSDKPDPFREPLNKLEKSEEAWPFASRETVDKQRPKENPVPVNLPGATAVATPVPMPPVPRPAPAPVMSPTIPIYKPAPISTPTIPVTAPVSATPTVPATPAVAHAPLLKNIRTYESDVAGVLANRASSRASIAIAESVKRGTGETLKNIEPGSSADESSHIGRKLALIVVSLALVGGGMLGGYYLYKQSPLGLPPPPTATTREKPPALVPFDTQTVMSVDGLNNTQLLGRIRAEVARTQAAGSIREIVPTEVKEGVTYRVPSVEMADIMGVVVPDIIARTLATQWMLGIYASQDGETKTPFVVANTNLFQNAFAGMLAWENAMPEDLKTFLVASDGKTFVQAPRGEFKDQIIRNKDIRAFIMEDGSVLMAYSFVDNSTLVMAGSAEALSAIISRLENKAFVR